MRIKIVSGQTKITSKGDIVFNTFDGDINFTAGGKNIWHGEKGIFIGEYEPMPVMIQPNTNRCIVEFRPPKNIDRSLGFDWFREGKDGDNRIDFKKIVTSNNFEKLQKVYGVKKLELSLWKNKPQNKEYSYDSWLAIYPPNTQNYGSQKATLSLLTYSDEDMKEPLRIEFDTTYFNVNKTTVPPLKKSSKGNLLQDFLTIECKKAFEEEQNIRILTHTNQEVGCLRLVPNSDSHRYKLKTRLVKVYLFDEDKKVLNNTIAYSKIIPMLNNGALSQCFLRPILEQRVQELDLTARNIEWEKYRKLIPIKGSDEKEKVIDGIYLDTMHSEIRKAYYAQNPDEQGNSNHNLIFFFINHKIVSYTEKQNNDLFNQNWDGTKGYTRMRGKASLIMRDGVDTHTLWHEALHARGLDHTFQDRENKEEYLFTKYQTDNIMDYSEENKNDNHQTFTYKWQWDKIKEVAEDRNIHVKLERENGNESKE